MKILNRSTFARGAFAAALLGALSAFAAGPSGLSPADGATGVAVHTSVQSEFLAKDEAARREFCASSDNLRTIRNEAALKTIWPEAKSVYYGHPPAGTFPQGVKLSWSNGTAPYAVEVVRVRDNHVFFSQPGLTERNVTVYNFELNCSYRWTVTDNNGASASATFKTDDVYPRLLWDHDPKGRVFGLRDLGGAYVSNGAYRVKQGVLFRCSKPYSNGTDRVDNYIDTTAIRDFWLQGGMDGLGLRTELDLRGTEASAWIKKNGPFEKYFTAGISDYVINTTSGRTEAIKALKYVLDSGNYPLFFHCSIGKDRTGTIAYLAEALLGMSDDDKMRDYESSWFWYTKGSYGKIDSLLDQIRAFSGATMNDKVVTFCTKNGIKMAQIDAFRAAMLEPVTQGEQKLWTGKTVAVLGDSYSAFEGVPGVTRKYYPTGDVQSMSKMWWSRVITEFDGMVGNVVAAAGSRIVNDCIEGGVQVKSFKNRLANGALGHPDVILVLGGLNDYWGSKKDPENCTAANLYAESGELFDTLDDSHPNAEKVVVLMNHPTLWNTGITNDFRCALRQAAVDRGYTVADLDGAYAKVSGDMSESHPNDVGMRHIAERVIATLNGSYRPPVHQHQYGAWVTNVAPTTTSTGLRTRTCTAWDCTWPAAHEEEVLPKQGAPVVVDPTKYGDGDLKSVTYTWKAGVSGPWEYTTNWTASASPCYGIPVAGNSKAVFSSAVTEGTRVTLSESINLATLTFANTRRLALTLDNGRITLPGNVRVGCTGPVDLTFKGDSPQLVTTEEYASGRLYFGLANGGETKRANLTFVLPAEPWVEAAAPIYSPESDTPIFFSNVTFVVDAAAVAAPAAGTAVTNVLAWSEDGVRPGTALEPVLANATFSNLPAGTAAQLIKDGHAIRCVISAAEVPPVDPTEYGPADTASVTYTWKTGVSGPWEYTTSWTASASPCYGIPDNAKAIALIPAETSAGTVIDVTKTTVNLKKLDVRNVQPLTLRFDGGRIAVAAASTDNAADVVFGKTGPATLVFEGAKPQLKITSSYNTGRLYFGETYETTLKFVMPTTPWTAADAPIRSTGEGANIVFNSHTAFEIDATAMAVPAEGCAVTNVLATVGEGGGLRDWSLNEYLAAARIDVPDGATGVLTNLNYGQLLFILTKRSEEPPPVVEDPTLFSWIDFGGSGSSDGAYFATDYVPDLAKTKIEMSFRMTDVTTQSSGLLYAGPNSAAAATGDKTLKTEYYYDKNGARTPWLGTTYGDESGFNDTEAFHALTLDCGACASKLDGAAFNSPKTVAAETGTTAGPLVIGAMTSGVQVYYNFAKMKLAYVRVSEKQTDGSYAVVHDWYPATNETGAAMLWDRVGKTFLEPSKKGTPEPFVSGEVVNPEEPHEHAFGEWAIVTEPTLEAAGEKRRVCACGESESETLPKLEKWVEVPAGFTVSNTIICLGDSLTRGEYADALTIPATPNYFDGRMDGVTDSDNYPYRLARSIPTNYNVIAQSKSGKSTDAIVSWFGGIPLKTTYKFTLPEAADELVQIPTNILFNGTDGGSQHEKKQQSDPGSYQYYGMLTPYLPLSEPVEDGAWDNLTGWLGGVHVRFGENHATSRTVCRTEPGESVEIPAGATFVPDAMLTYRDAIKVIFAGTNDGKENADKFLQQIADAVERTGTTRYIVVSSHNMYGTSVTATGESTTEAKFRTKFGDRHLNLRLAMVGRGVATANALGFTSVTQWNKQGTTGLLCSNDTTHYNTAGYAVVAQFVKEKLQSLGYLPADPEPAEEPELFSWLDFGGSSSSDGAYFATDYVPDLAKTRIEMSFRMTDVTSQSSGLFYAGPNSTASATGSAALETSYFYNKNGRTPWMTTPYATLSGFNDTSSFHALTVDCATQGTTFDGIPLEKSDGSTPESGKAAGPLTIGAMTSGVQVYYNFAKMRLAYFRVSEKQADGTYSVIHDWYPATNATGQAMLWDRVGKSFLAPAKTGTPRPFVSGEVVTPTDDPIQPLIDAAKSGDSVLPAGMTAGDVTLAADGKTFEYAGKTYAAKAHYVFAADGAKLVAKIAPEECEIVSVSAEASDTFAIGTVEHSVDGFTYAAVYSDDLTAPLENWTCAEETAQKGNGGALTIAAPKSAASVGRRFYRLRVTDR